VAGGAVPHPVATPELRVTGARNRPTGEIAPRRGNVHDVEHTVTHERIICAGAGEGGDGCIQLQRGGAAGGVYCSVGGVSLVRLLHLLKHQEIHP